MTALATFSFQGYTLRPAIGKDRKEAAEWTKADPDHRDTTPADFWIEQGMGIESYVLDDRFGSVFFLKLVRQIHHEIEIHIQFPPKPETATAAAEQRERVVNGLILGFEWLERVLILREVRAVFFTSKRPTLIRFAKKRLGFQTDGKLFRKVILPSVPLGN